GAVVGLAAPAGPSVLERRSSRALPLVAGLSSFVFFTLAVARAEHRFLLPIGFLLSAYVGVAADALLRAGERFRVERGVAALLAASVAWSALASFEVHLTQLYDARRTV